MIGTHYRIILKPALPLAFLQGYGQLNLFAGGFLSQSGAAITGIGFGDNFLNTFAILCAMATGTLLLVWMGDLVTEKGIGNGVSLIIFAGIVSTFPRTGGELWLLRDQPFQVALLIGLGLLIIFSLSLIHI